METALGLDGTGQRACEQHEADSAEARGVVGRAIPGRPFPAFGNAVVTWPLVEPFVSSWLGTASSRRTTSSALSTTGSVRCAADDPSRNLGMAERRAVEEPNCAHHPVHRRAQNAGRDQIHLESADLLNAKPVRRGIRKASPPNVRRIVALSATNFGRTSVCWPSQYSCPPRLRFNTTILLFLQQKPRLQTRAPSSFNPSVSVRRSTLDRVVSVAKRPKPSSRMPMRHKAGLCANGRKNADFLC